MTTRCRPSPATGTGRQEKIAPAANRPHIEAQWRPQTTASLRGQRERRASAMSPREPGREQDRAETPWVPAALYACGSHHEVPVAAEALALSRRSSVAPAARRSASSRQPTRLLGPSRSSEGPDEQVGRLAGVRLCSHRSSGSPAAHDREKAAAQGCKTARRRRRAARRRRGRGEQRAGAAERIRHPTGP